MSFLASGCVCGRVCVCACAGQPRYGGVMERVAGAGWVREVCVCVFSHDSHVLQSGALSTAASSSHMNTLCAAFIQQERFSVSAACGCVNDCVGFHAELAGSPAGLRVGGEVRGEAHAASRTCS